MRMSMRMTMRMSLSFSFVILIDIDLLVDSYFSLCFVFCFLFVHNIKMSCYWFNRQEILHKAKERYSKEKAAEYCQQNKEVIKEKSSNRYKN